MEEGKGERGKNYLSGNNQNLMFPHRDEHIDDFSCDFCDVVLLARFGILWVGSKG